MESPEIQNSTGSLKKGFQADETFGQDSTYIGCVVTEC